MRNKSANSIQVINGIHGYFKIADNKVRVMLSFGDIIDKLVEEVLSKSTAPIVNKTEDDLVLDWDKLNIYKAIAQIAIGDSEICKLLPRQFDKSQYIPSELAVELADQHNSPKLKSILLNNVIPKIKETCNQKEDHPDRPTSHDPFKGSINDLNNALRFFYQYQDSIRYVQDMDTYLIYQASTDKEGKLLGGGVWRFASYKDFEPLFQEFQYHLALIAKNKDEMDVAQVYNDTGYTNRLFQKIRAIDECIIQSWDLNRYPCLLNVLNGVIDLRTGELLPANLNFYFTQQAPVEYKPYVRSLKFEHFIEEILPYTRHAVLRYLGYCLTGEFREQKALFILGSGANGKSTLLNVMDTLLGRDYTDTCPIEFFSDKVIKTKSSPTPERSILINRRFIQVDEIKGGEVLDAGEFKLLTGSNSIPCRRMYKSPEVITNPTHKFIFSGNYLPELKGNAEDGGLIRRLMVAEFPRKFAPEEKDVYLIDKLVKSESLSGILNILVSHAVMYYKYGLYESPEMLSLKEEYISGLSKLLKDLIATQCVFDPNSYVLVSDLEARVNAFIHPRKLKQGQLKRAMSRLDYQSVKLTTGSNRDKHAYLGLKLK